MRSYYVGRGMPISLGKHTPLGNVGRGIPSAPLESIHDRTKLGVAYYHHPMTEHMIGPCRALHALMALGQHMRSNDVERCVPLSPHATHTFGQLKSLLFIISLGHHTRSKNVRRGMQSSPLERIPSLTMSGMACHNCP